MATDQGVIDVDKTYDPKSQLTLDQHREAEFAKIQQPGFGLAATQATPAQPTLAQPTLAQQDE